MKLKVFILILTYLSIQLIGVYLFSSGFFTIREQLPDRNTQQYIQKPQTNKVIFLIVDALKFEFANYDESFENTNKNDPIYNKNHLKIIHEKLKKEPKNTLFFRSIADAPTVTMQRIKAFITGNLPCFIEQANNFQAGEMVEDNLVYQLKSQGKSPIFMGDDTWLGLLPESFDEAYPFDSFNVWDLHSVDDGVEKHIFPAMEKNEFNFLIGHFLGVDHVGHRYNDNNISMEEKLDQINIIIEKVIKEMTDDTVLMVVSDHGMTHSGNHGGSTPDEVDTVLFAYSKQEFHESKYNIYDPTYKKSVDQIDIVPTISMLLGIPIPYNNLGQVIPDFILKNFNKEGEDFQILELYMKNLKQIFQYVKKIQTEFSKFDASIFKAWETQYHTLDLQYESIKKLHNAENTEQLIEEISYLIKNIKNTSRKVWNDFNFPKMYLGIIVMLLSLILYLYLHKFLKQNLQKSIDTVINDIVYPFKGKKIILLGEVVITFIITNLIFNFDLIFMLGVLVSLTLVFLIIILRNLCQQQNKFKNQRTDHIQTTIFYMQKVFHSYVLFSLTHLRQEEVTINKILLITLTLTYILIKYTHNNNQIINQKKASTYLVSAIFLVYFSIYFDPTNIRKYESDYKIPQIKNLLYSNPLFTTLTPLFLIYFFTNKTLQNLKNSSKIIQIALIINIIIISISYTLHYTLKIDSDIIKYDIPKINYILFFIIFSYTIFTKNQQKSLLFASNFISTIIPIMGENALILVTLYILIVYMIYKVYKELKLRNSQGFYGFISLLAYYFFLITGHRCQISALQFLSAYVGFQEFHPLSSFSLVTLNTFAGQFIAIALMVVFCQKLKEDEKERYSQIYDIDQMEYDKNSEVKQSQLDKFNLNCIEVQIHFFIILFCSALNCTDNIEHLLLVEDFAPKFMFDAVGYLIVTFIIIFLNFIH